MSFDNKFMKFTRICGIAGPGKTWTIEYRLIYVIGSDAEPTVEMLI